MLGICLVCAGTFASTTTLQAKKKVAYLFTYFTGNAPEQEQICYAISTDGFSYTPLNDGKPIISSDTISLKKGVRDPHILRGEDGYFYMVVTDMLQSRMDLQPGHRTDAQQRHGQLDAPHGKLP